MCVRLAPRTRVAHTRVTQLMGELVCQTAADMGKYDEQQTINTLVLTLGKVNVMRYNIML